MAANFPTTAQRQRELPQLPSSLTPAKRVDSTAAEAPRVGVKAEAELPRLDTVSNSFQLGSALLSALSLLNTWCILESSVGVIWARWFAIANKVRLAWHHDVLLFSALWLVYSADRWLDAWGKAPQELQTERHKLHAKQRPWMAVLWVSVLLASVLLALMKLQPSEWRGGLLLTACSLGYLAAVQLPYFKRWFPKELTAGALYSSGSTLFIWTHHSSPQLLLGVALFFGLVLFNLLAIATTERSIDAAQDCPSLARRLPRLDLHLPQFGALLALSGAVVGSCDLSLASLGISPILFWALSVASLASTLVYAHLPTDGAPIHVKERAHVLADLALLTPLPLFWL